MNDTGCKREPPVENPTHNAMCPLEWNRSLEAQFLTTRLVKSSNVYLF